MASQNSEDIVPESWEDSPGGTGDSAAQLAKDLSSKLNVNAPVFMPGQNVFAAEFVPTQARTTSAEESSETVDHGRFKSVNINFVYLHIYIPFNEHRSET